MQRLHPCRTRPLNVSLHCIPDKQYFARIELQPIQHVLVNLRLRLDRAYLAGQHLNVRRIAGAGVAQAAGDLRKALDALDALDGLLDDRKFEKAAALGYRDIASAFIFLQRTLGGLQSADLDRDAFTSSIAAQLHCAVEDAEPHVSARLQCLRPKPDLTDEERADAKARFQRRLKEMTSTSKA